jgi:formyltetrahydrofolate-dependent phosphoribosylglycinamide formyltransferase
MKKVAVFASGRGSNFEKFCIAEKNNVLPANISLLIASKNGIGAIETAARFGVEHQVFNPKDFPDSETYNQRLLDCLQDHQIEFIALAGWLRLIHTSIISHYKNRILNIHPALLPFFGGKGMYGKHVHQAVWRSGMLVSGATVHLVDPEYDKGLIVAQESVQLSHEDSPEDIAGKVLKIEHQIYPIALKLLVENRIVVKNDRISIRGIHK